METRVATEVEPRIGRRAVITAMLANIGVGFAKFIGFLITGSVAMLAECLHSIADTGNQGLLLLGAHRAGAGSSPEHPFGRGREHYFWAFVVGLVLFGLGGVVSLIEGMRKLADSQHQLDRPQVALALLAVAVLFEAWSLRVGLVEARRAMPADTPIWKGLRNSRNPDVTIVVLEDTGALVGLALAFVGISASWIAGNGVYDGVSTVAIGVLLCGIAAVLASQMHSLLIGEPASATDLILLNDAVMSVDGVEGILNLRTEHLGPQDLLICMKVELRETADFADVVRAIDEIEANVHAAVPATLTCYVEPDRRDTERPSEWT